MKKIKIWFDGMDGQFDSENNFISNILKKRYEIELSPNPDFVFCSVKTKDPYKYKCVRIYYTAENLVPDFNIFDYGIGFHYIDFEDRYFRFPLYLVDGFIAYDSDDYSSDLYLAQHKHENVELYQALKTDFCAFVYSNANAAQCREKFFDELSKYKKVNSGGRYRNNIGEAVKSKLEFQKKHKFVIAFENTSSSGYTTEKIVHAFAAGAIPIYWGNPKIAREFNPKSFINCHEFGLTEKGEPEALKRIVEEIIRLDNDDSAYLEMLKQPAFSNENDVAKKKEGFGQFLNNIFDQPFEEAYRRNRFYWGERYERKQRIGNSFYIQCRKLIPLRDRLKKILGRRK